MIIYRYGVLLRHLWYLGIDEYEEGAYLFFCSVNSSDS